MYIVGGEPNPGGISTTTVLYASINSNGTLGSWSRTTPLPTPLSQLPVAAYNGYVYAITGQNDWTLQNTSTVLYASINSNGTLGSWSKTTALPAAESGESGIVYNGYMYVDDYVNGDTDYAPVNSNGTLGAWATSIRLGDAAIFASNQYMYVAGSNGPTSSVLSTSVNSDGSLTTWSTVNSSLPTPLTLFNKSTPVYNGYVYIMGGWDGSNNTSTVLYASLCL